MTKSLNNVKMRPNPSDMTRMVTMTKDLMTADRSFQRTTTGQR